MIRCVEAPAPAARPYTSIHLDIANALAVLNKRAEAMESLREAIRLRPSFGKHASCWESSWPLMKNLGGPGRICKP